MQQGCEFMFQIQDTLDQGNKTHNFLEVECISLTAEDFECKVVSTPKVISTPIPGSKYRRAAMDDQYILENIMNTITYSLYTKNIGLTPNKTTQKMSLSRRPDVPKPDNHSFTIPPLVTDASLLTDESWVIVRVAIIKSVSFFSQQC